MKIEKFLTGKLKAQKLENDYFIPIAEDDKFLKVTRMVYDKQPRWYINGIFSKKGITYTQDKLIYSSFIESDQIMEIFKILSTFTSKKLISKLERIKEERIK